MERFVSGHYSLKIALKLKFPFSSNFITSVCQVFKFALLFRVFEQWIRGNVLEIHLTASFVYFFAFIYLLWES